MADTSVIYPLLDALVDRLTPALADLDVAVYDSYPDTDDPGAAYLVIGIPDPANGDAATSASSVQAWANANHTARDEDGDVWCVAVAIDGGNDARAARVRAKTITDAVEQLLRADYTLGIPGLLWTGYGTSTDLQQDRTDRGASALVVFAVHFRARI